MPSTAVLLGLVVMAVVPAVAIRLPWRWSLRLWAACALLLGGLWLWTSRAPGTNPFEAVRAVAFLFGCVVLSLAPAWRGASSKTAARLLAGTLILMTLGVSGLRLKHGDAPAAALGALLAVAFGGPRVLRWSMDPPSAGVTADLGWAWIGAYCAWHLAGAQDAHGHNLVGLKLFGMLIPVFLVTRCGQQHWLRARFILLVPLSAGAFFFPEVFVEGMATPGLEFEGMDAALNTLAAALLVPALWRNAPRWWRPQETP
ncbi:MAG: hypothetical protein H6739_38580 [Alphaproteobacteria bacterium]|nr:hypothetical protein [Alphaproteobacteria bacterium]